ncbi:MAG: hypothetical protein AB1715_05765 [Acidobacteriota bacterium]
MKWDDLVKGNISRDLLDRFIGSFPREFLIFLTKNNPSLKKEFAGFRVENMPKERLASKIALHFCKDGSLREAMLGEWHYQQGPLLSFIGRLSVSRLEKELPSLIKKHGLTTVYFALLFDLRKGTERLVSRLEEEARQKKLWEAAPESHQGQPESVWLSEQTSKRLEELEEQRDRLHLELEREKDSRGKLEDLYFSLKKENKDQKRRLEEAEAERRERSQRSRSLEDQESKISEYLSEIHALKRQIEKLEHDVKKERQSRDEAETNMQKQLAENRKARNELLFSKDQTELLQAALLLASREEKSQVLLPGTMITLVCEKQDIPSSFFKVASALGVGLLIHASKAHDQKLEDYISRSNFVLLCGEQFPEGLKSIVQSLCSAKQLPCYQLPSMKEKVFEDILNSICFIARRKSAPR